MENLHKDNDAQAEIERLYVEKRELLFDFVRNAISNKNIADDIVQEVFVVALNRYDYFCNHPNQMGWLYQTAKYKIMEYNKKMQQQETIDIEDETIDVGDCDQGFLKSEIDQTISETLTAEEKKRYYQYFVWGHTVEELAAMEGVSPNNIRVRITRLRKKLMQGMGEK